MTKRRRTLTLSMAILFSMGLLALVSMAQAPVAVEEAPDPPAVALDCSAADAPEALRACGAISGEEYERLTAEMDTDGAGVGISYVPPGWQRVDNAGTGAVWDTNDTFGVPNRITYGGTSASGLSMAAEAAGSDVAWDTELWSPPIDLTGATVPVTVAFESNFQDYDDNGDAYVAVSTDGGGSWTNLFSQTTDDPTGGELETLDLSAYVGETIYLGWRYVASATTAWYWHIDNVQVSDAGGVLFFEDFEAPPAPDLSGSTKTASPLKAEPGDTINYTIVLSNSGDLDVRDTNLADPIPDGTSYVADSVTCTSGTCAYDRRDDTVRWAGDVNAGRTVGVEFLVDVRAPCGTTINNTALVGDPTLPRPRRLEARTDVVGQIHFSSNFEGNNGGFVNSGVVTDTWAWGNLVPSVSSPDAAHSGTRLWATVLDGDIPQEPSEHALITTIAVPDDPTGVYMGWWDWWDEDGLDEGTLYVNTPSNTLYTIDTDQHSWQHHVVDLSPWAGQTVDLVFHHFSGGSSHGGAGWYIDDVAIYGSCPSVSLGPDQARRACASSQVSYQLEVLNANTITDTLDITSVADNDWSVDVDPLLAELGPGMTTTVSVGVIIPSTADPGDLQTLTVMAEAQTSGLTDRAVIETTSSLASGWADLASSPRGTRHPAVVYHDGTLYQIGGDVDSGYLGGTYAYDIAADTWATRTRMITPTFSMDGAAIDGNIYVPGGQTADAGWNDLVQVYSTATDAWSTVAPMPVSLRYHEVVADAGLLYVLGGETAGGVYTDTVQIYDPASDTWSMGARMPIPVAYAASGVIGGQIYVAGGYNGSYQNALQIYYPQTDSWGYGAPMEEGWVLAADGVKHDRYLILAGGYYGSLATASSTAWSYDAVNDRWSRLPDANTLRYGAEGASDGTEFYYVAGRRYDGSWAFAADNERLIQCEVPDVPGADIFLPMVCRDY